VSKYAGKNARFRASLLRDQNGKCFFCHLRLGEDNTLEHLRAKKLGGKDNYGNLRAAHAKCNSGVGHISVEEKMRLHYVGKLEGSDAFFRELNKIREKRFSRARRKTQKKKARKAQRRAMAVAGAYLVENPADAQL